MPVARYRDIGSHEISPRFRRQRFSHSERRVATDHRVPRGAAFCSAENRSPTKEHGARNATGHELVVLVRRILQRGEALIREKNSVISIYL